MSLSLSLCLEHIQPLPQAGSVSTFIIIGSVVKSLYMVSEMLNLAAQADDSFHSGEALADYVDSQIVKLESLLDRLCPELGELQDREVMRTC